MKVPALFGLILLPILLAAKRVAPPSKDPSFIAVSSQPLSDQLNPQDFFKPNSGSASYFAPISKLEDVHIRPSTAQDLENAVIAAHLNRFREEIEPRFNINDLNPTIIRDVSVAPFLLESNVQVPDIQTCRPVLSKVVQLSEGIFCGSNSAGCSITRLISKTQTYETSSGLMTSSSVSAGADIYFASVEASFTYERSWVETWGEESGTSTSYTFDLNPNSFCTPSMLHVELECSVSTGLYWWDTKLAKAREDILTLHLAYEYDGNRREPNMRYGDQWCMNEFVIGDLWTSGAGRAELWQNIVPGAPIRGSVYIGPNEDLNKYIAFNSRLFEKDEIVIRRQIESITNEGDRNVIFRCTPSRPARSDQMTRIPVRGPGGVLQGFVGCV